MTLLTCIYVHNSNAESLSMFKCHALGMSPRHQSCQCDAGDTPDEVVITAHGPHELWSSPGVFQMILKAAHDGAQAMLLFPRDSFCVWSAMLWLRVDVVFGASWNSSWEITLWPMVNEMDWLNSAGMLSSFWMDSTPISQVTDKQTGSLVALKHSPGSKIVQALFKKIETHQTR